MGIIDAPVKGGNLVGNDCGFFERLFPLIGLETGETPLSVLEILGKELLSGETSPDHLVTDFPGQETEGPGNGCIT